MSTGSQYHLKRNCTLWKACHTPLPSSLKDYITRPGGPREQLGGSVQKGLPGMGSTIPKVQGPQLRAPGDTAQDPGLPPRQAEAGRA